VFKERKLIAPEKRAPAGGFIDTLVAAIPRSSIDVLHSKCASEGYGTGTNIMLWANSHAIGSRLDRCAASS
jgi:hypothetical protein